MSEPTICRTCLRLREGLCDGEKEQTACPSYKRMTNGDKIRSMSDEELAMLLNPACPVGTCPDEEPHNCYKCWLDWLKQEVSDNGKD